MLEQRAEQSKMIQSDRERNVKECPGRAPRQDLLLLGREAVAQPPEALERDRARLRRLVFATRVHQHRRHVPERPLAYILPTYSVMYMYNTDDKIDYSHSRISL